jgi:hypothetical protein
VAVNTSSISATFSEEMDNATITATTFTLRDNLGTLVPGTVSVANRTAAFQPAAQLAGFSVHTAMLSTDIRDAAGNSLRLAHAWTFTTGSSDLTPPTVVSVFPNAGVTCAAIDTDVSAVFSESVDPSTVTRLGVAPGFTLTDITGGPLRSSAVSGARTVAGDGTTGIFDPDGVLGFSRTYTATLSRWIRDLAGNTLPSEMTWTFSFPANGVGVWQPISVTGAPSRTTGLTAVWSGSEMITFGAGDYGTMVVSGRYSPASDSWASLPIGGPSARVNHVAVWTGVEMIVWGGAGPASSVLNDGGRYNPATDSWAPVSTVGAPSGRSGATAVWTGSEMIVWGGMGATDLASDHAAYHPATDTWRPISSVGAPSPNQRARHTAVWTGSRMIVWGGDTNCYSGTCPPTTGGRYDPAADTWYPVASDGEPSKRTRHSAVWTGSDMAVWGGSDNADYYSPGLNTGALYDPSTDSWREIPATCGAAGRYGHSAVWTGGEMIVWGGRNGTQYRITGARYSPSGNSWQHMPIGLGGNPITLWTGTKLILWGPQGATNGAIYSP